MPWIPLYPAAPGTVWPPLVPEQPTTTIPPAPIVLAPPRQGWACPRCGACYSPDWPSCIRCLPAFAPFSPNC